MTDTREAFEKWWNETKGTEIKHVGLSSFTEEVMFHAWSDATLAERERCADICEQMTLYTGLDCANQLRGE